MHLYDKLKIKNRLRKEQNLNLKPEQLKIIEEEFDEKINQVQREYFYSKITIRVIYLLLFGIISTASFFFVDSWIFTGIMLLLFVYNFIHALQDYIFYRRNFKRDGNQKS